MSDAALEAIGRTLAAGGDADDVLRAVITELEHEPGIEWAGILFQEGGELVLGPEQGTPDPQRRRSVPVTYEGVVVGELAVDGKADTALLERVALALSAHVLLGWDTGGEAWSP